MDQQQPVSAKYLGTVKVSRDRVKNHIYPTLRLPESLGDIIGKRVGVYAAGDQVIISSRFRTSGLDSKPHHLLAR